MNKEAFSIKFKKFINDSIKSILAAADLPSYSYSTVFESHIHVNEDKRAHGIQAEIEVLPEYQSFTITIYKNLEESFKKGFNNTVFNVLCHEIGHVHTEKLYDLAAETYKTEEEVRKSNEELSTKIGNYLYKLAKNDS